MYGNPYRLSSNGRYEEKQRLETRRRRRIPSLAQTDPLDFDISGVEEEVAKEGVWIDPSPSRHPRSPTDEGQTSLPPDALPLDGELQAEYIGNSGHLFRSRRNQIVVNIHCRGRRNLGTQAAASLFAQALHSAKRFGTRQLIFIHGHHGGQAWKKLVLARFGASCCETFQNDLGKTLVHLDRMN